MMRAASCASRNVVPVLGSLAGLMSTATRTALGLMQQSQPLGVHLLVENIEAGHIAARTGEARHKTKLDRVIASAEDDRDYRCRSFGRKRCERVGGRVDHGHQSP